MSSRPYPSYEFGSMIPWKKAGWYLNGNLLTKGQGEWIDDSVHGGEYSSFDKEYIFRWLGPSPSGNFKNKIPDNYIVGEKSFQELDT